MTAPTSAREFDAARFAEAGRGPEPVPVAALEDPCHRHQTLQRDGDVVPGTNAAHGSGRPHRLVVGVL